MLRVVPGRRILLLRLILFTRAWRTAAAAAEQAGQEAAAALLAVGGLLQLRDLGFQLFDPLVICLSAAS